MKARLLLLTFLITLIAANLISDPLDSIKTDPPEFFNLMSFGEDNYVTSVKSQQGGTCWAHGTMSAMESNLLMSNNWAAAGDTGEPNLAEYHLDWWNGFNQHNNDDIDTLTGNGLVVHEGGDYRVASAYIARGEGTVRDIDGQSFNVPPLRDDSSYRRYYARHIEWYSAESDLSNINVVKQALMDYGAMGTCMLIDFEYWNDNYCHYQPPTSGGPPNHAIAIVGWDDTKVTQAPLPGAWRCKNSWGTSWGQNGFFWISFHDRHCGKHNEMGAVSFREVELLKWNQIYYHDYHGWRDEKEDYTEAFNAFKARGGERIESVNFFTAAENIDYIIRIYDYFEDSKLSGLLTEQSGSFSGKGLHTVNLDSPLLISTRDDMFYVYLSLSEGGMPYDRTSEVPVLLGAKGTSIITSKSEPDQSFYMEDLDWHDMYYCDNTANFCMKALGNVLLDYSVDQSFGEAPLLVSFNPNCTLDVVNWSWNFSDGEYSSLEAPVHTFEERGIYNISVDITCSGGETLSLIQEDLIMVFADTLAASENSEGQGESIAINVSTDNMIPVRCVILPIEYQGDLDLSFDSASVVGCRTYDFENPQIIHSDSWTKKATIKLTRSFSDSTLYLSTGEGIITKLYFTIDPNAENGISTPVIIDGYNTYLPQFTGSSTSYNVTGISGLVSVLSCCENRGNADGIITNGNPVNVADLVYLVDYLFKNGSEPPCLEEGNANGISGTSGSVDVADLTYLVRFLFYGDSAPPPCN